MAAVSLAMRLYELDHGLRPVKLADLVPDYLPFVPKDPFAADGRQISYALDAAKPVLYSIGPNGIDDGGDPNSMDDSNDSSQWGGLDIVFYLNGDRPENYSAKLQPASPSTTQPASAPGDDGSTEK